MVTVTRTTAAKPRIPFAFPFRSFSGTTRVAAADAATAPAATASSSAAPSGKAFPEYSSRAVAYWLLGSAASVFGIVVFGGLTRLTESG